MRHLAFSFLLLTGRVAHPPRSVFPAAPRSTLHLPFPVLHSSREFPAWGMNRKPRPPALEANVVKLTIPLPPDNLAGAATESVWAEPQRGGTYKIKNIPFYARGISCEDVVEAEPQEGALVFRRVIERSGHSTYRIYAPGGRATPDVESLVGRLREMHCDIEPATDKLVGVDVLPEADIYKVYEVLRDAERNGTLEFEEGHCGHPLRE